MTDSAIPDGKSGVPCLACPLRLKPAFKDKNDAEISFMQSMKIEPRHMPAGADIIHPGQQDAEL